MAAPDENSGSFDGVLPAWLQPRPNSWLARILLVVMTSALLAADAVKILVNPFWRLYFPHDPPPLIVRTPESRFEGLDRLGYDFEPNYVQVGPSGRGQPFVDIEIRVALQYKKFVLWRKF